MKTILALVLCISTVQAQFPDPPPLETRVTNLETRIAALSSKVAALEAQATTIGVKNRQFTTYSELKEYVKAGNLGTLAIGVNQPADLFLPSGAFGMPDGVYSLFPGDPMMQKRFGPTALGEQTVVPTIQTYQTIQSYPSYQSYPAIQSYQSYQSFGATNCANGMCDTKTVKRILPNFQPFNGTFR